jgi:hypothetical protein
MRRLAEVPGARSYLACQALSIAGDTSLYLALAVWVRELTHSSADAGLTFFFLAVPAVAGPMLGAMADRVRRRPLLIAANTVGGLLTLGLLGVRGPHQVWLIYLVVFGYGTVGSLQSAAQSGLLHTLLPDELIGHAAGMLTTVRESLRIISPVLGVGLFTLAGGHAVAILDSLTFAAPVIQLVRMRVTEPTPVVVPQRLRTEVAEGLAHIRRTPELLQMVVAMTACCCVIGILEPAGIAVITDGLHLPVSWIGPQQVCMGLGALVGGPTVARAMRRFGEGRTAALGMLGVGVGVGLELVPSIPVVAVASLLFGVSLPWLIAPVGTASQRRTPNRLQGRVSATIDVLFSTPQAISIAVGSGLLAVVGFRPLLAAVVVVMATAGLWLATRREQRPVSVPGAAAPTLGKPVLAGEL